MALRGLFGIQGGSRTAGVTMSYQIVGLEQTQRAMQRALRDGAEALAAGLVIEAERIMTESKRECPVDIGTLRSTGHVQPPDIASDGSATVQLGYGGPAVDYALRQHEDTTLRHEKRQKDGSLKDVGKAKYLEDPLNRARRGFDARLARHVALAIKRRTAFQGGAT